jgi:hypothetical protein
VRSWIASLAASAALLAAAAASAQEPSFDELLARFHAVEGLECRFREEKRIALLTVPIVSEGTLHYQRPRRVARRITSPSAQVVLVEGDSLRMREGTGPIQSIDLAAQPVVRTFVDTFAQLLRGERAPLERTYEMTYVPGAIEWSLAMRPRASPLDRFVRTIRFSGSGTTLRTMVVEETSGDVATTTFSTCDTQRRYTAADIARIFAP